VRIAKIGLGQDPQPFGWQYKNKEDARRAIDFMRIRGELWVLESELNNYSVEQVQGIPCGTGWPR
jgi:hypothetical protein